MPNTYTWTPPYLKLLNVQMTCLADSLTMASEEPATWQETSYCSLQTPLTWRHLALHSRLASTSDY